MLPKEHRLVESEDFTSTLREGCRASNRFLSVTIAVSEQGTAISRTQNKARDQRLGLIVAKRQVPSAVRRNRLKRVIRHRVREQLLAFPPGTDVVVRVFAAADGLTGTELGEQLHLLLGRAGEKCGVSVRRARSV